MTKQMDLNTLRREYKPKTPSDLSASHTIWREKSGSFSTGISSELIQSRFPLTVNLPFLELAVNEASSGDNKGKENTKLKIGVVLSGGQAPGGHNVICGLYEEMQKRRPGSELLGFIGGPSGIIENKTLTIDKATCDEYINTGGFNMIGSGRTKIKTAEQFEKCLSTINTLGLHGLVVIGGDDSNTNSAELAEYFLSKDSTCKVVGVPKTIDGDLKNQWIDISFGFDTATKVYSELIANIARDAISAKKYYHFIRLMGRSASHITWECALKTNPNLALISEEVKAEKRSLTDIVDDIANLVIERHRAGKNYGIVLIPEGIVEFIPEMSELIDSLNLIIPRLPNFGDLDLKEKKKWVNSQLLPEISSRFDALPEAFQDQLLLDRDSHGNVQVSRIESEKLLVTMVEKVLKQSAPDIPFSTQTHFLGYEGRAAAPSNFDANYCYSLGKIACDLIYHGKTGYMAVAGDLAQIPEKWTVKGIPLVQMMQEEMREGNARPVITKSLVNTESSQFQSYKKTREAFRIEDHYRFPGPIQYFGPDSITEQFPIIIEQDRL